MGVGGGLRRAGSVGRTHPGSHCTWGADHTWGATCDAVPAPEPSREPRGWGAAGPHADSAPSSRSSSCRDHSPAPLCDPRPWFLGVSSWRCLQALSLLRGHLASACLKGRLCRLADKRGPGAASCEWVRYRPSAPSATSPQPAEPRGLCRTERRLWSPCQDFKYSPCADQASPGRVQTRETQSSSAGALVPSLFSVPEGVLSLDILFLAKKCEINCKDSVPPGTIRGPPEERSPAVLPSVPTFQGLSAATRPVWQLAVQPSRLSAPFYF